MFRFLEWLFGKKKEKEKNDSARQGDEKKTPSHVPAHIDDRAKQTPPATWSESTSFIRTETSEQEKPSAQPYGANETQKSSAGMVHSAPAPVQNSYRPGTPAPGVRTDASGTEKPTQPFGLNGANGIQGSTTSAARPAPAPVQSTSRPRVVSPRSQGRVVSAPEKRVQKSSVYIGLDFGTTFTKAAYEIAPSNVHIKYSVKFGRGYSNEDYYLPSVLYFDPETNKLKIFNDTGKLEEIRYFKYNMISDALQKNKVLNASAIVTQSPKEQLCCVFFLSYVIYLIKSAVKSNSEHTIDSENTTWYINMGVPLEAHKNDKRASLYKKVLEAAYLFEQKYHGRTEADIHDLDEFFAEHKGEQNPRINILPEIYAEVLLYQQYLNTPAGFYTVVDIGGGTEDIATFLKMTDRTGEKVDCLAQNVIGYGYDAVSEKVADSINPESVKKARDLLSRNIDFNNDESLRTAVPKEVNFSHLLDARRECRTLFGTCVQRARRTRVEVLQQTMSARLPMRVFVMGGARSVEFYRSSIEFMKKAQENAGIPFFKDGDVLDFVGRNTRLEIRNDQRLIISQMLAQPFEMIPEIDNMPWDLKEKDVTSSGMSWLDLQERQNELYPV